MASGTYFAQGQRKISDQGGNGNWTHDPQSGSALLHWLSHKARQEQVAGISGQNEFLLIVNECCPQ